MKNIKVFSILLITVLLLTNNLVAQEKSETKPKLYDVNVNPKVQIQEAIVLAKEQEKHILIQCGGNWCGWCIKFHEFVNNDEELQAFIDSNFVSVKINYSRENRNLDTMRDLGYPQRFGFPVFVILDSNGERIHIQNTVYLEEEKGYNKNRVMEFFKNWSPDALNPENYK